MSKEFWPDFPVLPRPYGHSADGVTLGAGLPRFRVKAWRQPNEDGQLRFGPMGRMIMAALDRVAEAQSPQENGT